MSATTVKQLGQPPGVITRLRLAGHAALRAAGRVFDTVFTLAMAGLFIVLLVVAAAVWDALTDMPWPYWVLLCATGLLSARALGNCWQDVLLEEAPLIAVPVTTLLLTLSALQGIASVACGGGWHAWFETTTGLVGVTATIEPTIEHLKIIFEKDTNE